MRKPSVDGSIRSRILGLRIRKLKLAVSSVAPAAARRARRDVRQRGGCSTGLRFTASGHLTESQWRSVAAASARFEG